MINNKITILNRNSYISKESYYDVINIDLSYYKLEDIENIENNKFPYSLKCKDRYIGFYCPCSIGDALVSIKYNDNSYSYVGTIDGDFIRDYNELDNSYIFYADKNYNIGDPIKIYNPENIEEIKFNSVYGNNIILNGLVDNEERDFYSNNEIGFPTYFGTSLKKLVIENSYITEKIIGLKEHKKLEHLEINSMTYNIINQDDLESLPNLETIIIPENLEENS